MAQYTVVESRRIRSVDPANASGYDTLVTYTNPAGRLNSVTVAGDAPAADAVRAAIAAHEQIAQQHAGTTFEL
jgi:hypothetical protein